MTMTRGQEGVDSGFEEIDKLGFHIVVEVGYTQDCTILLADICAEEIFQG
ncbi:MAG: hypothetical protein MZV63_39430 [Marinilabiliales bacterium]|nr:hypothetical protein [Marinilabiliales bacterium]